ncbi:MAG: sensor histidine kinase, partial [Proteobacteria bacterium]
MDSRAGMPGKVPISFLAFLLILALLGNLAKVPLFFGVDFIFGSIAVLVAVFVGGPLRGGLVGVLPAAQTYFLWNHPYAAIALLGETFFVGLFVRRFRSNLALAGLLYWFCLGIPFIFLTYRYGLAMELDPAILASLKQGANGITNAICASLLTTYVPWIRRLHVGRDARFSLFETVFNSFIAAALIPIFFILTFDARRALGDVERDTEARLGAISTGISLSVARWRDDHLRSIAMLAGSIEDMGGQDPARIERLLASHRRAWHNFHGVFLTNERGITLAFDPLINARGESTIGINFADRAYFQNAKAGANAPAISELFLARGGVFEPTFNITSAVRSAGRFAGVVSGSLNLKDLAEVLGSLGRESGYSAALIDEQNRVITATSSRWQAMQSFTAGGNSEALVAPVYRVWPADEKLAPMLRWRESSLGMFTAVPGPGKWRLAVELPLKLKQGELYERYARILSLFLALAFLILITSYWVATAIARPLALLSAETTDIPESLRLQNPIAWPRSRLLEVNELVKNFRRATGELKQRFADLETSRALATQANRTKDEFLSVASHELKTPLTPLKIQLQMLRRTLEGGGMAALTEERLRHALTLSERQIVRITRLIEDLLDVARINSGKLKLTLENLNLTSLVKEVAERYGEPLKAAACTLEIERMEEVVAAVDPLRFEQVVVNLLNNAAKYAPGTKVSLALWQEAGMARLLVEDGGRGIPAEDRERIFERFEQVSSV